LRCERIIAVSAVADPEVIIENFIFVASASAALLWQEKSRE
jgi:hypothetical protein